MLTVQQQYQSMLNVSSNYKNIESVFRIFNDQVKKSFESQHCQTPDITIDTHSEKNYFQLNFSGRNLIFLLSTKLAREPEDSSALQAEIKCLTTCSMKDTLTLFDSFTFSPSGSTEISYEPESRKLSVKDCADAGYIALYYMRELLCREEQYGKSH